MIRGRKGKFPPGPRNLGLLNYFKPKKQLKMRIR